MGRNWYISLVSNECFIRISPKINCGEIPPLAGNFPARVRMNHFMRDFFPHEMMTED